MFRLCISSIIRTVTFSLQKLNYLLFDEMFSRDIRKLKFSSVQHSEVGYKYNHLIYNVGCASHLRGNFFSNVLRSCINYYY